MSIDKCETLDLLELDLSNTKDSIMILSKAFRYVNVQPEGTVNLDSVSTLYEFSPVAERGSFKSSDDELNKIYDVAKYTSRIDNKQTDNVTRYANMFGIFFNYFTPAQKLAVKENVLLNDKVAKITTPYMRFYELEALCAMGEQPYVLKEMKSYWGGMLKLGATSFWEEYNPTKKDTEHLAMYGRPFGKSLCHAWGASPIYLLGKYYLGVKPTAAAYQTYVIEPNLGGLTWMEGKVPTNNGEIELSVSKKEIKVKAAEGIGTLRIKSTIKPSVKGAEVKEVSKGLYEITIQKGVAYVVKYQG